MKRLAPASILADLVMELPRLAASVVLVVVALFLRGESLGWLEWSLILAAGVQIVSPVATYLSQRYQLTPDGLEHHFGVLTRAHRTIGWDAVTATEVEQPWIHRLLGIYVVTLSQGGGEDTKVSLRGIDVQALANLRAYMSADQPAAPDPTNELYRATSGDLLMMAAVRGQVIVLGLAGLTWLWNTVDEIGVADDVEGRLSGVPVAVVIATLVLGALIVGVGSTYVTYYGFWVRLEGGKLITSYGLLNRKERRIDPAVVRGVVLERNLAEKMMGRARLGVLTRDSEVELATNTVLPTLPIATVNQLSTAHFPEFVNDSALLDAHPRLGQAFAWITLLLAAPTAVALTGHGTGHTGLGIGLAGGVVVALIVLLRGLNASFHVDRARGLVYVRRRFVGERLVSLKHTSVQRITSFGAGRGKRYVLAALGTFAGTPETYWWVAADRSRVEAVSDACLNDDRE